MIFWFGVLLSEDRSCCILGVVRHIPWVPSAGRQRLKDTESNSGLSHIKFCSLINSVSFNYIYVLSSSFLCLKNSTILIWNFLFILKKKPILFLTESLCNHTWIMQNNFFQSFLNDYTFSHVIVLSTDKPILFIFYMITHYDL